MQPLERIDINFKVNSNIEKNDICFYSVLQHPFSIHGLTYEDGLFRRMPEAIAKATSPGVHYLHTNTSGGRVRFKTDSRYIAISTKLHNIGKMDHFALTGSAGFDLYADSKFVTSFRPPFEVTDHYQSIHEFQDTSTREITINFPLYSGVYELYIGLQNDADVQSPTPYSIQKPVIFYGNSVTQGGCASRPGNSYPNILSRWFNFDYVNLGFSGNGKGEQAIVDYMANMEMSMFIMDYDHNSPDVEHLQKTHPAMYHAIRSTHPNIPIIMMTAISSPWVLPYHYKRRDVIYKTYREAIDSGDKNVYFWDGTEGFAPYADYGTVEGSHPNDLGFHGIAEALSQIIKKII